MAGDKQGLVAALQWMTQRFEKRTGILTVFRTSHDVLHLPAGVPLVAYRTAQEALTTRGWTRGGVDKYPPIVARGVLVDIPRLRRLPRLRRRPRWWLRQGRTFRPR